MRIGSENFLSQSMDVAGENAIITGGSQPSSGMINSSTNKQASRFYRGLPGAGFTPSPGLPPILVTLAWIAIFAWPINRATGQDSASYPYISPTEAASGMTTGIQNGATQERLTMMQVRAAAQEAERAAAAAAMARSAEEAIEGQKLQESIEEARETRRKKMEAAERLKWEKIAAQNAYRKVTPGEMKSWKDQSGNIKIGRDIPSDFAENVRRDEAARAAAAAEAQKKEGFKPFKKINERIAENDPYRETGLTGPKPLPQGPPPTVQQYAQQTVTPEPEKKGLFSKLSFPSFGKKSDEPLPETPQFANVPSRNRAQSQPPQQQAASAREVTPSPSAPQPSPSTAAVARAKPATGQGASSVSARSGSDLLRTSQDAPQQGQPITASPAPPAQAPPKKKFSLFSFGKKKTKPQPVAAPIDTGLFPAGAIPTTAASGTGATNGTMVSYTDVSPTPSPTPTAAPQPAPAPVSSPPPAAVASNTPPAPQAAPPQAAPPEKKKLISFPSLGKPSGDGPPAGSTVNPNGHSYYVVGESSQFMKYGDSQMTSTISAIDPGTVVVMTKPGDDWATVRLSDGSSGVIQTKHLRKLA